MKIITFLLVTLMLTQARAELSVSLVGMYSTPSFTSRFDPVKTFKTQGVTIRTSNSINDCYVPIEIVKSMASNGREFIEHLKKLDRAPKKYILYCYLGKNVELVQIRIAEVK